MAGAAEEPRPDSFREWITSPVGAAVVAAITIAIVAFVAFGGADDDNKPAAPQAVNPPAPLTVPELASMSKSLDRPVYWAGPQGGAKQFDVTRQPEDRIVIRYPATAGADPAAGTLTVGTYKLDDALSAVRRAGSGATTKLHELPRGGLAVSDSARPTNVYLAYPKQPYQVEVFDPQPGRALKLVLRGRVRPVR